MNFPNITFNCYELVLDAQCKSQDFVTFDVTMWYRVLKLQLQKTSQLNILEIIICLIANRRTIFLPRKDLISLLFDLKKITKIILSWYIYFWKFAPFETPCYDYQIFSQCVEQPLLRFYHFNILLPYHTVNKFPIKRSFTELRQIDSISSYM